MDTRGNHIRTIAAALAVCLTAGATAFSAQAAPRHPVAATAKKCKRKHHGKRRPCRRRPSPASISISPSSQDFGLVPVNGKTTRIFTVTNTGGSPSGVPVPAVSGPNADAFSVGPSVCTRPLTPKGTCQFAVHLSFVLPTGIRSGTLDVTAVPGGTVSVPMTGDIEL